MKKTQKYPRKLFITYSFVCLAALFLFFLVTLFLFYKQQYEKSVENQSQLAAKTSEQIDVSLQNMDRIVNGLLFNKSFIQLIKDPDAMLHYTDYSKQIFNAYTALDAPLFTTHRIIAFNNSLYYNLSKTGENQSYIKNAVKSWPWKRKLQEKEGQKLILPPHQDTFESPKCSVYSVARAIADGNGSYGVIEVQNDCAELEKLCSIDRDLGQIMIFSPDGQPVYPLNQSEEQQEFFKGVYGELSDSSGRFRYEGRQICYRISDYSGWVTILYCPIGMVVPYTMPWVLAIILIFILLAVNFVFAIRIVTDRMTAPLVHLNEALKEVSLDNLSLTLPQEYGIEEIENINQSFLAMFEQLKQSIARTVQARANEERANYLALQSQMNPHTIYNTIGMIESVSYMNGDMEVSKLCVCFSHMLRYLSDFTREHYYIQDEVEHLNNYSTLIRTRYDDCLDIIIHASPALMEKSIPKFTLQPLVENSVKHGFSNKFQHLVIRVDIQNDTCGWLIRIEDNGCGFTPERLSEVREQLKHCDECLSSHQDVLNMKIGSLTLSNIYIRCRIMFGPRLDFTVGNNTDAPGCFIQIKIREEAPDND